MAPCVAVLRLVVKQVQANIKWVVADANEFSFDALVRLVII